MKNKFALLLILVLSLLFVSCGKNSFKGSWYFESAYISSDSESMQKMKEAGLDIKIIVYPDESRFELFASTGGDYKKMNEGKLGKYDWTLEEWYFQLPDKETGKTIEGSLKIEPYGDLSYHIPAYDTRWSFSRKKTGGGAY